MAVQPAKKVIELPPSFTPRPEVPDGAGPWKRNLIVGKWYDENRQAITELFHNEGYPGLEKAGISFATAKGLWKKWDLPAPGAPPAESAPARLHSAVDWPSYQDLLAVEASGEERLKWLELTHDLVAAGKLVLH